MVYVRTVTAISCRKLFSGGRITDHLNFPEYEIVLVDYTLNVV